MTDALKPQRLLSLDVFRGMTIALMILVNTPGSWSHVFPPLLHAKWHGATPTDMVFPFFLFIVGVSLYLSFVKFNHKIDSSASKKIIKRTILIFLIGLALHWFPFKRSVDSLRIMGVLQRIAVAYGIAAFLCLSIDIKKLWKVGLGILLAYWGLMYFFGGADPYSLENNLARTFDLAVFGENHVWKGFGIPFDPEGLMSTFPAVVTIICGYYVGWLIKTTTDKNMLIKNLLLAGVSGIIIGLIWNIYFPINKGLWTSSYVIYTAGIACCVLAILIELIDVRNYQKWTKPFQVFGLNPLIIFVLSGFIVKTFFMVKWENSNGENRNIYSWLFNDVYSVVFPNNLKIASLAFALTIVSVCWLVGYLLYKKKVIMKV